MLRLYHAFIARLDVAYRDRSYFVRLKARLLGAFSVVLLVWVPLNVGKLILVHPPEIVLRLILNACIALAATLCFLLVDKGQLERAGNWLTITLVVPTHILVLFAPEFSQPLGAAIQLFVFDLVFLLFTLVFASRRIAFGTLAAMIATIGWLYFHALRGPQIDGSMAFAAATLLRDGLVSMGFIFCIGITLVQMIEAAQTRSEEALRETKALNENLEQLVSNRTRELEVATRRAQESSRAKSEFLANMSHEIRTPLNGVIASADLLRRRVDLSTQATEHVRIIAESGDLLLKLLSDILDFSKIEAGQLALEQRPFQLAQVVADTVGLLATTASAKGVKLEFTVASELRQHVSGDSHRLRQVLLNLTSNAVKFTAAGGSVQVAVTSADPTASPLPVRFAVSDTGIGIDPALVPRLFDRFTQADSSTTRRFGGSGLGLAISSHLVRLMGGRIEVQSTLGQGSTFFFTLTLPRVTAPPDDSPAAKPAQVNLALNVLVAEDNPVNRTILAAQLTQLGCRFEMAHDGAKALAVLENSPPPDLILMDCHMPNLDGWEATRRIRAWSAEPDGPRRRAAAVPIIALTAAALPEERQRCADAGMDDFLSKPVKLSELQTVLTRLAKTRTSR
jgi:signal transduction histidine kinase/CheY-like chemotaxis protein